MTQAVRAEFTYQAREAEGTQLPAETLRLGSGTCRDFALLMMEAARSLGLAARFVTGYLYGHSRHGTTGQRRRTCLVRHLPALAPAGSSMIRPTACWQGANLIRVGVSRAPEQASPIAGGFMGDPNDPLGMIVSVDVMLAADETLGQMA